MDLSKLAVSQDSYTFLLKSPITNKKEGLIVGEPIPDGDGGFLSVDILSSDSNVMKKALSNAHKEARKALKGGDEITERESYLIQCRAIAQATTGCNLILGSRVEHSEDAIFDIISKPDLCVSCKKDGHPGEEEILCNLTRADQQGEKNFHCEAYEPKE